MKKVLSVVFVILMFASLCLAVCSCGGGTSGESAFNPEAALRREVDSYALIYCSLAFNDVKTARASVSNISSDGDIYTVQGYVIITDNYGDTYEGKLNATYVLKEQKFYQRNYNVETPRKTN